MKKFFQSLLLSVILVAGVIQFSKATLYTVEVADFQFTQAFDTISIGDTIKWVWINGTHSTTSNGVPAGAVPWNILLDNLHTSFTYVVAIPGTYTYISVPDAPLMGDEFVVRSPVGIESPALPVYNFNIVGNPSRDKIEYSFILGKPGAVDISLYDILGKRMQTLYQGSLASGPFHHTIILTTNISQGLYFVTMKMGDGMLSRRVVIQ